MIRLVIIEDEDLIRLGIKTAINQEQNIEVVGESATGSGGMKLVEQLKPDIVLIDIGLPDISGLDLIYDIKSKTNSKVIALTCHSSQDIVNCALQNGADSYILKRMDLELIKHAINTTYQNNSFIDPEVAKRVFQTFTAHHQKIKGKKYTELPTATELQILKLMSRGLSNKEIAEKLFVTVSTVKGHSSNLFSKLGVRDRVNAILKAKELGYLDAENLRVV
ncbi:response regulator [Halotia branconii]|uniref:Response regulator transcription factor n=1 Tax=Halotia branconii CENA392 TaxID=1539056 RepID=A0AAJ6PCK9_9CYAN|nr:response regulator transcription factor [Halotia branconii]WGV29084.1 response regulator transcription factor [Halotia branconii CENA392]